MLPNCKLINYEIKTLFPTTILRTSLGRSITNEEIKTVENLKFKFTASNLTTESSNILQLPELKSLRTFFETALDVYVREIMNTSQLEVYITQSWANITTENQNHHKHAHPNSFLSGVFYLSVNPTIDTIIFNRKDSAFLFEFEPVSYNIFNSNSWTMGVKNGDLLIFPSNLEHSVPRKYDSNKRISVAFNTFVKGLFGKEPHLNELQL